MIVTILIVAVIVVAVAAIVAMVVVRPMIRRAQRRTAAELEGRNVVYAANATSLGVSSAGKAQVRGSGTLALCHDRLVFVQWVPSRTFDIPLVDVTAVDTCRSHLGKSFGSELLRIAWTTADGADQVAFRVADLDRWLAALHSAVR